MLVIGKTNTLSSINSEQSNRQCSAAEGLDETSVVAVRMKLIEGYLMIVRMTVVEGFLMIVRVMVVEGCLIMVVMRVKLILMLR